MTDTDALVEALAALAKAREVYQLREETVWLEVQKVSPSFADRLRELGFDERAAAAWVCQPGSNGRSAADEILEGRSKSVLDWLEQGMAGFVG